MTAGTDTDIAPASVPGPKKILTIAKNAPTDFPYEILVDVGETPPTNATGVSWKAKDPSTGTDIPANKATWGSVTTTWDGNNLSSNTLTVDDTMADTPIEIALTWDNVPLLNQTPTTKDITFKKWDQPTFTPVTAGRSMAEANLSGGPLSKANTIDYSVKLSDAAGPLVGAEVQWSPLDGVTYVGITKDDFSSIDFVPSGKFGYYPTITDQNGYATIRANAKQSIHLSLRALMPGFPSIDNKPTGSGYFVSLDDPHISQDFIPVTVDVDPTTGYLDISGKTYIGASFPDNIPDDLTKSGNTAWLYMKGGKNSYLVNAWGDVGKMGTGAYIPTANLDQSGKDDNFPILFIQDPGTKVHASGFSPFPTIGTKKNVPPTAEQANRDASFKTCHPVPNPGLGNWLKSSDVKPSWHVEVPMNFPSTYDGWYIFFIFYLNGYDIPSTAYASKADTKTIPDISKTGWENTAPTVTSGLQTYSADLDWPAARGFGPNDLFEVPYSYVDYYITPPTKFKLEQDAAWIWSRSAFYCKLNTR